MVKRLKLTEFKPRGEPTLRGLVERAPFLQWVSFEWEPQHSSILSDWQVEVKAGNRLWSLLVEEKRHGQPREVRTAVLELQHRLRQLPNKTRGYGVLVAPFLSEESARICIEAGIGYADLAGNARLSFDQVFIETRMADNPFREKREARSLFAPKSTRVLRVLLQGPLRPWKVTELAKQARVSLGWVSAVRQQLLAREWAAEVPGGILVTKPVSVLETWAKADDWKKRTRTREYSVLVNDPVELAEKLKEALPNDAPVFTQGLAGWLRHPHTTPVVVTAYVADFPDDALIREKLLGRQVPVGSGSLRLVQPKDEGVLHPSQTVRGHQLVSDVQIYLDLLQGGLRGEEQAEELRRWPDFAGGWA